MVAILSYPHATIVAYSQVKLGSIVFQAGKAAIAKADTLDKLQEVVARMDKRKPDLSDEQNDELLRLAVEREAVLSDTPSEDPFADD